MIQLSDRAQEIINRDELPKVEEQIELFPAEEESDSQELPAWCSRRCPRLEEIPGGEIGCVQNHGDMEEWRRIDTLKRCPRKAGKR